MNHRELVTAVGAGVTAFVGGCLTDDGGDGAGPEPLDGEWILRGRVRNEDDEPRGWRVESRSQDRESVGAAWATLPAGEEWALELRGQLFDERREVYVESDNGSVAEPWRPTECRRLFAGVNIVGGEPRLETECREQ